MASKPKATFTATTTALPSAVPGVTLEDFVAYLPRHLYIFTPCREIWVGGGIANIFPPVEAIGKNGQPRRNKKGEIVLEPVTRWLDKNRGVQQVTWCPGQPMLIQDRVVVDGGWIEKKGITTFNWYRPPHAKLGDAAQAQPWLDHVRTVLHAEGDAAHCIKWLAHRVQRPGEKINHALVLGGAPGIGKDTLLEPVKYAVGPWNFHDVSPTHLLADFNSFAKSVILRINEGRDLGEIDRFKFYDRTKIYTAAPPDVLRVNEKHMQEYYVFNVVGVVVTTNHKTDGIYVPADDRRHYVAWSDRQNEDFAPGYWDELWGFYASGGLEHVTAYLATLDLSDFDPKAPPPKTAAFWDIVNANQPPEDAELADLLDALGQPDPRDPRILIPPETATLAELVTRANGDIAIWLLDRRNRRQLPHRLERCGFVSVRNPTSRDGLWRLDGARQVIYARSDLTLEARLTAAQKRVGR
jgi:hypothetical protein